MTVPRQDAARAPDVSLLAVRITAAALCAFGASALIWVFHRVAIVFPEATLLAVVLELPLLIIGVWLLRLLRPLRPPPWLWSAAAVIWGGTAGTGCALLANEGLLGLWAKGAGVTFASTWSAALSAPLNEEVLKLAGVVLIALAAPLAIRGPLDGTIYGALTGLGFQVMENITYGLNNIVLTGATDPPQAVLSSAAVRVGLTALGSHWTMTGVAGAGVGYLVARGRRGALPAIGCLATAMAMHLLFDAPRPAILLKVAVNFVIVTVLYLRLRRAYLAEARSALSAEVASGAIPASEAATLLSRHGRRRRQTLARSGADRELVTGNQQAGLDRLEDLLAPRPPGGTIPSRAAARTAE